MYTLQIVQAQCSGSLLDEGCLFADCINACHVQIGVANSKYNAWQPCARAYIEQGFTGMLLDATDASAIERAADILAGGGLLGLEAANGLMKRGMQVTVVHASEWLMERQLDPVAGQMLQKALQERGMEFLLQAQTQELLGNADGRVCAIRFKDGSEIPADLVVMAVGIRPNTALAESMRLHVNRGIVVNDTMQTTTDARIYAVGECAAHRGTAYGLVAPLFEQGKVLANHLAEFGIGRYLGSQTSTKLKVTGIDLFSAGDFMGGDGSGGNAVGIVNGLAQVDGLVRRIVVVRQMAWGGRHLDVRDVVVFQHLLSHFPSCHRDGNLGVFAETAFHPRADQPAQKHGAQQNQPVNGIGMLRGGFRRLGRVGKEVDIE